MDVIKPVWTVKRIIYRLDVNSESKRIEDIRPNLIDRVVGARKPRFSSRLRSMSLSQTKFQWVHEPN